MILAAVLELRRVHMRGQGEGVRGERDEVLGEGLDDAVVLRHGGVVGRVGGLRGEPLHAGELVGGELGREAREQALDGRGRGVLSGGSRRRGRLGHRTLLGANGPGGVLPPGPGGTLGAYATSAVAACRRCT